MQHNFHCKHQRQRLSCMYIVQCMSPLGYTTKGARSMIGHYHGLEVPFVDCTASVQTSPHTTHKVVHFWCT